MPFLMRLSPLGRQRLMFLFLSFVWGTTWLAMKVGIASVPPGLFAGTRWTIAGLVLLAIRRSRGEIVRPPPRLLGRLLLVSVLLIAINQSIQLYGLRHITAGLAAVISSALTPISLLGFSVALGQERFSPRQLGAIALGVVGVLVLFGPAAFAGTLDVWEVFGALGVIIGCLSYSLGSVLARPMMRTLAPVQMSGLTNLIGGVVLLLGSLALEPGAGAAATHLWRWDAALSWLYLLIPGSLMATTIYFLLVRDWGASRAGTYAFVSPVIAVVFGCWLFGEKVDWGDAAGMALMLLAAALALRPGALAHHRIPITSPACGRGRGAWRRGRGAAHHVAAVMIRPSSGTSPGATSLPQGSGGFAALPPRPARRTLAARCPETPSMSPEIVSQLAPHRVLRAGINMSNFLLVTGRSPSGDPDGVSPDMARAIADRLGVPVQYVPFPKPGELADAAENDVWDIGLIGAEPARAEKIVFTAAYVEIEATYLVPAGSPLTSIAEVDRPDIRIAVTARSAYDLWLERNIRNATLVRSDSQNSAFELFVRDKLDAMAGLRPGLIGDAAKLPGSRILDGQFTAVQQAIGTPRRNAAGAAFLRDFVEEAKRSGMVARLIEKHGVVGRLSVAPLA